MHCCQSGLQHALRPVPSRPAVAERVVYYREAAANMYSAQAYLLAQVLVEVPFFTMEVVLYRSAAGTRLAWPCCGEARPAAPI